jgi:hypothetical protein
VSAGSVGRKLSPGSDRIVGKSLIKRGREIKKTDEFESVRIGSLFEVFRCVTVFAPGADEVAVQADR